MGGGSEGFCRVDWPALMALTASHLILFPLTGYLLTCVVIDYRRFGHPNRIQTYAAFCGALIPIAHLFVPWSWVLQSRLLNVLASSIVAFLSLSGSAALFTAELLELYSVFRNSADPVPTWLLNSEMMSFLFAVLCFIAWFILNNFFKPSRDIGKQISLLFMAAIGGLLFVGGFLSLTYLFCQRLLSLVKNSRSMDHDGSVPHINQIISVNSHDERMKSANDIHSIKSNVSIAEQNNHTSIPQTSPKSVDYPVSSAHPTRVSMNRISDRIFLKSIVKKSMLSSLVSLAVMMVMSSLVVWSISDCLDAAPAYSVEFVGYSLALLRIFLGDKHRSKEYDFLCGCFDQWALETVDNLTM